jgi:hypothetical protein
MSKELRTTVLRGLASNTETERLLSGIATLVIFPVLIGVLGAFSSDIRASYGAVVYWVWLAVATLFILSALRLQLSSRSSIALVVENERLSDRIHILETDAEQLTRAIDFLALQVSYNSSARAAVLAHAQRGIQDVQQLREALADMAAPLYLQGEFIFDFKLSEKWSFTIYLYSAEQRMLLPVWRERAKDFPSLGDTRSWGPGEGHVGKAFVDQKSIVTGDVRSPEAAEFSSVPPQLRKEYDDELYVSFASIPIGPILEHDNRPYGVLVGTSNRAGRFDRENAGILFQVAGTIASLLITSKSDIDKLPPPTPQENLGKASNDRR